MNRVAFSMCIAVAVLTLASCGKKDNAGEDGGEGPTAAPADAPGAPATPAPGADMGSMLKAGVWEMTTAVAGVDKGIVMKMCMDEALTKRFTEMGAANQGKTDCSNKSVSRLGNTVDISATCKDGERTVNSKIHVEMQGDNAYHQTIDSTFDPPLMGKSRSTTTIDGKWLGTCEANGMKAGDMIMPGGMKMNMIDMKKPG